MTIHMINDKFKSQRGKSGGYPEDMHYVISEKHSENFELCIEDVEKDNKVWKRADSWGFAAFYEASKDLGKTICLKFAMRNPSAKEKLQYEAFKRRLSYLTINNNLPITLTVGGKEDVLYSEQELKVRPTEEIVRGEFKERGDEDTPGRLEKDFQTYLFGKGLYSNGNKDIRTNERLALFGEDFIGIGKRELVVEREFPTGVFYREVKDESRILPTEFVDLVTINKHNEIAIIELKFDDAPLEVIAQLLNYALFFSTYKAQLSPLLDKKFKCISANHTIKAYIVSNKFHQRFCTVWPYYSNGYIQMQQIIMGYTPK